MTTRRRLEVAAALVLVGLVVAVFGGTEVGGCLGPLGVTEIECMRASGRRPTTGLGALVLAIAACAAALIALPIGRAHRHGAIVAAAGAAAVAAIGYHLFRPISMTGPTSTGEVITVDVPIDLRALLAVVVIGGTAAAVLWDRAMRMVRPAPI